MAGLKIETHKISGGRCPACLNKLTAATTTGGFRGPRNGDRTICAYCLVALEFVAKGDSVRFVQFDEDELTDEQRVKFAKLRQILLEVGPPPGESSRD